MVRNKLCKGIVLMLLSSLLTCTGQLCWKMSVNRTLIFLIMGFGLYGCGAVLMIIALRYGELSQLHPLLSAGYILSAVLGAVILDEPVTVRKAIGIAVIIAGLILINLPERKQE